MSENEYYVGIDIGTYNSYACLYFNEKVKIIPNKMPSVILFENNSKYYVGEKAFLESVESDKIFISEVKRFIGLTYNEFIDLGIDKSINYSHLIKNIEGIPKIEIENNDKKSYYTAEDITSFLIKEMIQIYIKH